MEGELAMNKQYVNRRIVEKAAEAEKAKGGAS